jgi:hypothetical protein
MAPEERRYTAAEWLDIQGQYREQPKRGVRAMFPDPNEECDLGPFIPPGGYRPSRAPPEPSYKMHAHLEAWFSSVSAEDVKQLEAILKLRPETVAWIAEKNPRELKSLDGAVEFVTSSRTAAKVLAWCFVTAATAFGLVVTAAKNGIDLFQIVRGGKG